MPHFLLHQTLAFNPQATLLVSGSADNSVRLISVPAGGTRDGMGECMRCRFARINTDNLIAWTTIILILITFLAIVLAFVMKQA